jgi:hypothetical protein
MEPPPEQHADLSPFAQRLRAGRWGLTLALLTLLFGFGLGGVFGAAEDTIKGGYRASGEAALATVYGGDATKLKGVLEKSWAYSKRAHLHGGGLGAAALAAMALLAALARPSSRVRAGVSLALGLGAAGYSGFWLLAARAAPALGGGDQAKESLSWLAIPSAGLLLLGLAAVLALTVLELFGRPAGQGASAAGRAPAHPGAVTVGRSPSP